MNREDQLKKAVKELGRLGYSAKLSGWKGKIYIEIIDQSIEEAALYPTQKGWGITTNVYGDGLSYHYNDMKSAIKDFIVLSDNKWSTK